MTLILERHSMSFIHNKILYLAYMTIFITNITLIGCKEGHKTTATVDSKTVAKAEHEHKAHQHAKKEDKGHGGHDNKTASETKKRKPSIDFAKLILID